MWEFSGRHIIIENSTSGNQSITFKPSIHSIDIGGARCHQCSVLEGAPLTISILSIDNESFVKMANDLKQLLGFKRTLFGLIFSTQAIYYDGRCSLTINMEKEQFASILSSAHAYCASGGSKSYSGVIDYLDILEPISEEGRRAIEIFANDGALSCSNAEVRFAFLFERASDRIVRA